MKFADTIYIFFKGFRFKIKLFKMLHAMLRKCKFPYLFFTVLNMFVINLK